MVSNPFPDSGQFYQGEKEGSLAVTEYNLTTEAGYTTRHQVFKVVGRGCRLVYCFGISVTSCCAMRSAIERSAQSLRDDRDLQPVLA